MGRAAPRLAGCNTRRALHRGSHAGKVIAKTFPGRRMAECPFGVFRPTTLMTWQGRRMPCAPRFVGCNTRRALHHGSHTGEVIAKTFSRPRMAECPFGVFRPTTLMA